MTAAFGAIGALLAAGLGAFATLKVAGPVWERAKLGAVGPLTEARLPRYQALWKLTDCGPEAAPTEMSGEKRLELATKLERWYYEDGAGLLLSDDTRRQWVAAVNRLKDEASSAADVWRTMSCLRTRLKQDVHVHDPTIDDTSCRQQPGWKRG